MNATVLVVDDEAAVNDAICDVLLLAGYRTLAANDGIQALRMLREQDCSLIVLDLSMPRMDGLTMLTRLRDSGDTTPVIVLTARQSPDDVQRAFEAGADDFVRKPFGMQELTLRAAAVLRRTSPEPDTGCLRVGEVLLDYRRHGVWCSGEQVQLSPTEFRLLRLLMEHVGEVLSKDTLLRRIWGLDGLAETTVVETYVSYLRRKLGDHLVIRTVRGFGYELLCQDGET
ncbi:MAG: response regulator transcription factor [Actinomycetales bacterium]|nr:response regulator transcription factor [Actinomycetales bacterium]